MKPAEQITYLEIENLADEYGPSFYLFSQDRLEANFTRFRSAFLEHYPDTLISYSYKTNYTPAICRAIDQFGGRAEVVSDMEWSFAVANGVRPENLIYNGPNKSWDTIGEAFRGGALVQLDCQRDWEMVKRLAAQDPDAHFEFGLRLNFELRPGQVSRFGFDMDGDQFQIIIAEVRDSSQLEIVGLHCHFPNRDVESFGTRVSRMTAIAAELLPAPPKFLNLGGGFYGEMSIEVAERLGAESIEYSQYAEVIGREMRAAYPEPGGRPILILEPGTAIVADTMRFVTQVIDVRDIRGKRIATVDGSLFNTSPYSRTRSLPLRVISRQPRASRRTTDIVGFTCIESDVLSRNLPSEVEVGDFLMFENVGSYSVVMKPPFILPSPPILRWSDLDRSHALVRRQETGQDILQTFVME